jgi:hypothetical protein
MEEASSNDSSHTSSLSKFFDKEMLKEIITMRDVMKEMCEDRKESIALEEQLMAMKKRKTSFLKSCMRWKFNSMRQRKPLPSTCMNIRYVMLAYLQIPLKMNVFVFLKITEEE